MKNKKGFISTSLIYSFFLVFIAIVVSVVVVYSSRRLLLVEIKNDIRENIGNKEKVISKHYIVQDVLKKGSLYPYVNPNLNEEAENWGMYILEDNDGDSYYFRGNAENYFKFGKSTTIESGSWQFEYIITSYPENDGEWLFDYSVKSYDCRQYEEKIERIEFSWSVYCPDDGKGWSNSIERFCYEDGTCSGEFPDWDYEYSLFNTARDDCMSVCSGICEEGPPDEYTDTYFETNTESVENCDSEENYFSSDYYESEEICNENRGELIDSYQYEPGVGYPELTYISDCFSESYGGESEENYYSDYYNSEEECETARQEMMEENDGNYDIYVGECYSDTGETEIISDLYWRVIRINGDGTIRLIYDGDNAPLTSYADDDAYYPNSYVDDSLKEWYINNSLGDYQRFIADTTFCNDLEVSYYENIDTYEKIGYWPNDGYEYNEYYKGFDRIDKLTPSLKCSDDYILSSNQGNQLLDYPVGLITADEAILAGLGEYSYLNKNKNMWTMTPSVYNAMDRYLYIYTISADGSISETDIYSEYDEVYAYPVININAGVNLTGTGIIYDPYCIDEDGDQKCD